MGSIWKVVIGIMFASFLVLTLAGGFYRASNDVNKTQFSAYSQCNGTAGCFRNLSALGENNLTYTNNQNSVSNMQSISENMFQSIAAAQRNLEKTGDIGAQILGAFGLVAALTVGLFSLLIAVPLDGLNFIFGVASNITALEAPWSQFALLGGFGLSLFVAYMAFKFVAMIMKWDI